MSYLKALVVDSSFGWLVVSIIIFNHMYVIKLIL